LTALIERLSLRTGDREILEQAERELEDLKKGQAKAVIEYEFSEHAYDMLRERNIREDWVKLAI
jgi:hypothetical protein